jgi:glycosyltransferase involved in cell wall biosynthesis
MSVYIQEKSTYLAACLQSLATQTVMASEIVLVEDGPINSDLNAIIEHYREPLNIVSVRLHKNIGLAGALNEGLQYCLYDLVARMDSDDIALPDRFKKQIDFMGSNPDVAASSGCIEEINDAGEIISQRVLPLDYAELARFAKVRSPLSHPATIFRKSEVLDVGGYPPLRKAQDYALWSLLITKGKKIENLPDLLIKMRAGDQMMTRRSLSYFKYELQLLQFQKKIGFLTSYEYARNLIFKFGLRAAPVFLKKIAYKSLRK